MRVSRESPFYYRIYFVNEFRYKIKIEEENKQLLYNARVAYFVRYFRL